MPIYLPWSQVAVRLACTLVAGALIGLNRDENGHQAGLRTTILVCLAAAVAMLQANLLMPTMGRGGSSPVTLDLMRLPLGILTGIGFIGAGAIVKRGRLVTGVTTAATLWLVTVIGLCFGGGQIILGAVTTILAILVLWNLKWLQRRIPQVHRSTLVLRFGEEPPDESRIRDLLLKGSCLITSWGITYQKNGRPAAVRSQVRWRSTREHAQPPAVLQQIARLPGIAELEWKP